MKHTDDSSKTKFANQRANHKEKREREKESEVVLRKKCINKVNFTSSLILIFRIGRLKRGIKTSSDNELDVMLSRRTVH